jgi:acetyl esterase
LIFERMKVGFLRRYYRLMNWYAWRGAAKTEVTMQDTAISSPEGSIPLRIYRVESEQAERLIVYFHGGGWVLGDLETHRPFCEQLCASTRSMVVAVDYRLAPGHPFPAAVQDCQAATRWVLENSAALHAAGLPVFVAGDSAGGNLAAVVAKSVGSLAGQILIYPVTAHYSLELPSYAENASGYGLTRNLMIWFWDTYLRGSTAGAPSVRELSTPLDWESAGELPPALVLTAEFDPLRDEGIRFSELLSASGTPCRHRLFNGALHGFLCSEGLSRHHLEGMLEMIDWLDSITLR